MATTEVGSDPNAPKNNLFRLNWYYRHKVKAGWRVYKQLIKKYGSETQLLVCPWPGTGDAFQTGLYIPELVEKGDIGDFRILVGSKSVFRVLSLFPFSDKVVVLSFKELQLLEHFFVFIGEKNCNLSFLHHNPPETRSSMMKAIEGINCITWGDMFCCLGMGLDIGTQKHFPVFPRNEKKLNKFFEENGLRKGETVVISPYANTFKRLDKRAWRTIVLRLKQMGYCVCTVSSGDKEPPLAGTVPVFPSYAETPAFLEYAGAFVGMRSGLFDIVGSANCKMVVVHQPGHCGYAKKIDLFNLNRMNLCKEAVEFEMSPNNYMDTVARVLDEFDYLDSQDTWMEQSGQKNKMVSVIIPAYNCAPLLGECLESILNQDKTNIEIIAIDNGSTDNTGAVIDEYCALDQRVKKLYIEKNQGVSNARNLGMKMAKGDFFAFCDGDDFVPRHAYSIMAARMMDSDADIVVGSYFQVWDTGRSMYCNVRSCDEDPIVFFYGGVIWNKMYRRDFLTSNNLKFERYNFGEDTLFLADCLEKAPVFATVSDPIYHHKNRKQQEGEVQLTRQFSADNLRAYIHCGTAAYTKAFPWGKDALFPEYARYLDYVFWYWWNIPDKQGQSEAMNDLKQFIRLYEWDTNEKNNAFKKIFGIDCDSFLRMTQESYFVYRFSASERQSMQALHREIAELSKRLRRMELASASKVPASSLKKRARRKR